MINIQYNIIIIQIHGTVGGMRKKSPGKKFIDVFSDCSVVVSVVDLRETERLSI